MINKINAILEDGKLEGKDLRLKSNGYKELIKQLTPIAKQFVDMLAEQGYIKRDAMKLNDEKFWGLRANISFDNKDGNCTFKIKDIDEILLNLDIKPQLVILDGKEVDLFFRPNQVINLKSDIDYISLVNSFIDYIHRYDKYNIKFLGWNLDNVEMISNIYYKDSDISFAKELFDSEETLIMCPDIELIEI